MKIAIIGKGGREHALCWKIKQSHLCDELYCIPGNAGTEQIAENINLDIMDFDGILKFCQDEKIDLTIVGPEDPLCNGIVDVFEEAGLKIFGPNKKAAQLEASKDFSKKFMNKYGILTAQSVTVTTKEAGIKKLENFSYPCVIKADGLCLGKGVFIVHNYEEAAKVLDTILVEKVFGNEGQQVVIEEYLDGIEVSQLCFVSNETLIPLETTQDYKKIGENDTGENTGGVGCLSPSPFYNSEDFKDVYAKIEAGLKAENIGFKGILFIGFIIVKGIPYVLEFNTRFGDPETEVLMPRLKSDLIEVILDVIDEKKISLTWKEEKALAIVLTAKGYPGSYRKKDEIKVETNNLVFHNGTLVSKGQLLTNGGRILTVVTLGDTWENANIRVLSEIDKIHYEGKTYRKDIGLNLKHKG